MESVRSSIRAAVVARRPVDDRERLSIERFVTEFDRLTDPFREDSDPVHVTASGIVIGERGVLLHRHRRLGIWIQPGGHIDEGETPWQAAWRETVEETGLDIGSPPVNGVAPIHVDVHPGPRHHTHLDLRYLIVVEGRADPVPPPGESQEVVWFDWAAAIEVADPGLRGALIALRP